MWTGEKESVCKTFLRILVDRQTSFRVNTEFFHKRRINIADCQKHLDACHNGRLSSFKLKVMRTHVINKSRDRRRRFSKSIWRRIATWYACF